MTRIILSTSNLINGSSSISRRPIYEKSNTEFTSSLSANLKAARQGAQPEDQAQPNGINGTSHSEANKASYKEWTQDIDSTVYVPSLEISSGLAEERPQYDITVKLFFLPTTDTSKRCAHTEEAVNLVLKELGVSSLDLLIISFPGIFFDADDDEFEEPDEPVDEQAELDEMVRTWQTLEDLQTKGIVRQIGLSEFGSERLKKFLPRTKVRPSVDQINVRDCCVVPKSLILYAKQEKIELLTHNDCTNILPKGTIRELLGPGQGAGVLSDGSGEGLKGEVDPQWVIKYTAVVRDRGVIENKGYFAMAQVRD